MSDAHSEASAQYRPTKGVFGEVIFSQKDKKTDVSIDMMLLSTSSSLPIFSTLYISNFYLYFKQVWLILPGMAYSRTTIFQEGKDWLQIQKVRVEIYRKNCWKHTFPFYLQIHQGRVHSIRVWSFVFY